MSRVRIEGLTKRFGAKPPTVAIDDMTLDIESGEFLVLLGPSGCGKTTTLRSLAGLETPDEGRITFGDRTVFDAGTRVDVPPDQRRIGMVFQSYALWPHMTVRKNIGYPLQARRVDKDEAGRRIEKTAELVDCAELLDRYPGQISGGQQQRVALARGLVAEPDVVFFDEPLSNLDARLRDQVRTQLHELHGRLGFTAVFVTHDQSEALALGDRLAIMRNGAVEQFDTPQRVFEEPATEYVAEFIGVSNRLPLVRTADRWMLEDQAVTGEVPVTADHEKVAVRLRPGDLDLGDRDQALPPASIGAPASVVDSQFGGRHMDVTVAVADLRLHARVASGARGGWARSLKPGQPVTVYFDRQSAIYYDQNDVLIAGHISVESQNPGD